MIPQATLIPTQIDFNNFLLVSNEVLGYSPAAEVDSSPIKKSNAERFIAYLARINGAHGDHLYGHVMYSVLILAEERDAMKIMEITGGMAVIASETIVPCVLMMVVSGTLLQWRNAVASGQRSPLVNIRGCFERIKNLYCWQDVQLLLEHQ